MAYDGGYQNQQRAYAGPAAPRPNPTPAGPGPGPGPYQQQPHYDDYQGGQGYDYYDDGGGAYDQGHGGQYQDPRYAQGPPDTRYPPDARQDYYGPPQPNGPGRGAPMNGGRGPPGPMRGNPYPPRGGYPQGPGRGYQNAPPGRGGPPPGGYGRGPPPPMNLAGAQGRPPMNDPMRSPGFNGGHPAGGQYVDEARLSDQMGGMDLNRGYDQGQQGHPDPGYQQRPQPGQQGPPANGFGPPMRSVTMPANDVMQMQRRNFMPPPPPQPMDNMAYGPGPGPGPGRGMPPPNRPATSQGYRPPPQRIYPPAQGQGPPQNGYGGPDFANGPPQGPPMRQASRSSYDDIFDSYNASSRYSDPSYGGAAPPPGPPNDAPNFDRIPSHGAQSSLDLSLHTPGSGGSMPPPGPNRGPEMSRTKSQPNLRNQGPVFEMPGDAPPMPALPPGQFGGGPGGAFPPRGSSSNNSLPASPAVMRPNGGLPQNPSPPQQQMNNPDALPSHPTPVRPGLMADSMVSVTKPPPMRTYTNASPAPSMAPQGAPPSNSPQPAPAQDPVTPEELERLRVIVKADPNDQETALRFAKRLVEAADVLIPNVADPKTRGRARERYLVDAHKVLKKLCGAQNRDAMFFLADSLGRGLFGEADHKEAFTMYQSAAKMGHAAAAYRTAVCCEIGHEDGGGTKKDPLKAMQWYKRAATLGDTPAMYKVGMILLKGLLGQPRNPREAISWLKRAADQADAENPHALHELGLLYEAAKSDDIILRDEAYALSLFRRAADLGYKFSQFRLGAAYEYGLMGCPVDPKVSIAWYSRAAAQGEHQSELALSGWYLTGGDGVLQQSDTEAYLWARKAAMAGLAKAEFAMGYYTEYGIGVPANMDDAKRWYWRAAAQNSQRARERLEELKRAGKSGPRQRERISRSKMGKQQEGECSVM